MEKGGKEKVAFSVGPNNHNLSYLAGFMSLQDQISYVVIGLPSWQDRPILPTRDYPLPVGERAPLTTVADEDSQSA